jgi:hypothetical protein
MSCPHQGYIIKQPGISDSSTYYPDNAYAKINTSIKVGGLACLTISTKATVPKTLHVPRCLKCRAMKLKDLATRVLQLAWKDLTVQQPRIKIHSSKAIGV